MDAPDPKPPHLDNQVIKYSVAILSVAAFLGLRGLLQPALAEKHYFFFPLAAVSITAVFGGLGPSILATFSGFVLTSWLFIAPEGELTLSKLTLADQVGTAAYFAISASIISFAQWSRSKTRRFVEQQRKYVEEIERREASYQKLAAIVESSAEAIIAKDLNGIVTSWNRGAQKLFGYTAEEIVGASILRLLPKERKQEEEHILAKLRDGQSIISLDTVRLHKSGERIDVSLTISPIRNPEGKLIGASKVAHDIRPLKRAEEALRKTRDELEKRVEERTRDLSEALEKAQEVDRLKSEFLATMSHELRTPLNSIIGFTEIIMEGLVGPINEEQKRQLAMAHGSARHLLSLISDLLDLARIESGRVEPAFEPIKPREVIMEAVASLRPQIGRKGLKFEHRLELPDRLVTDRKMFFQIILNLLNNAVKFTQHGQILVKSEVRPDRLIVAVEDTGIGIKPDQMKLLFEAFRQVEGSARRRYEGTGLGLYLCRKLAAILGGDIWVESEYGKGSTFAFWLPRKE